MPISTVGLKLRMSRILPSVPITLPPPELSIMMPDAGPARQEIFVGNQDKFPGFLGMFGRVQQVRFRGEGQALQIVQRADRFNIEAEPAENLAIMSRERQDHPPEIAAELFGLEPANNRFRQ